MRGRMLKLVVKRSCWMIPVLLTSVQASGQAISGRPVPSMTIFDTTMTSFMNDNDIEAAVLGIMHGGQVQYLRGFGSLDSGVNMPENALVRLASCVKPMTAAAIRQLDEQSNIDVTDFAFNLNGNGGVLNVTPFPGLGDNRLDDVTLNHLLQHRGGWDRSIAGDLTYMEIEIADDMGVSSPPGRTNTMRWILGQPLEFTPGAQYEYSNIGYLALGLILSNNAPGGYEGYVQQQVLTPAMWVPGTEMEDARTFRADRNAREPWYRSADLAWNVYSPLQLVSRPYGGFDVEARLAQGGIIASAAAMLELGERYHISPGSSIIGLPVDADTPLSSNEAHNGAQSGVNTYLWHRTDDTVVFVFFNRSKSEYEGSGHYGTDFINLIDPILDAGTQFTWPGTSSDGFWVTLGVEQPAVGFGGYHSTYRGFASAASRCASGSKVRLKAGSQPFTGVVNKKLLIDAPLGSAIIGQ